MAIVAGVDFGTLSVRVSIVDSKMGRLGSATADYELIRTPDDPDHATQRHDDQIAGLLAAMPQALSNAGINGAQIEALAIDTTGSSVIPVGENLQPLDDYYMWCDHRAKNEAAKITQKAHALKLDHIDWSGGVYSSEWGFSKVLHWLRNNTDKRTQAVSFFEHCDLITATLCGIYDAKQVKRSICAAGHKWMWNADLGGVPPESFLVEVGHTPLHLNWPDICLPNGRIS